MDLQIKQLATTVIEHSIALQKGEKVYIDYKGSGADEFISELINQIYEHSGIPFLHNISAELLNEILKNSCEEQLKIMRDTSLFEMKQMDCYISVRAYNNNSALSDVSIEKLNMYTKLFIQPVHLKERVNNTKWVVLEYPTPGFAQMAKMSLPKFKEYYFNACTLNYSKLRIAMEALVNLMNKTDKVHIMGLNVNLTFSIKDIPTVPCYGIRNLPDGEIYTAPVKDSINGFINYNTPSIFNGHIFENIKFTFLNGKIIEAEANNSKLLNEILDTDEGARYIGEFSLGVNPFISTPIMSTLFDEKISGSFHLTPGACYKKAPNGNDSAIHWDLVLIQTKEYGGGDIYFDKVLIRKDGLFVLPELECLNPNNIF